MFRIPPTLVLLTTLTAASAIPENVPAQGSKPKEFEPYSMATVTVTVTADAPTAAESNLVTEVSAEEIKATNARTVAEALAFAPGLRVSTGRKNEPNVSIHGFDQSRILVLIDGVPYYETAYGKLDLNQIPIDNVARIEITKGAASVLFGANAMGGVINIITKKAADVPFTGATVELGENATRRVSLTHGQKVGEVSYWLNAAHRHTDGFDLSADYGPRIGTINQQNPKLTTKTVLEDGGMRDNSDVSSTDLWAKVGVEKENGAAYWANLHYLDLSKGAPISVDGGSVFVKRPAFSHFVRIPLYRDTGIDLDVRQPVSTDFIVKGKVFYHDHVDDYDSYADQWYHNKIATSTYKDNLLGASAIGEWKTGAANRLRFSLNYKADSHRERDDSYLPFAESQSRTGSVGIEDEWQLSARLSAVLGVSHDWFDVTSARRNVTSSTNGDFVRQDALAAPESSSWNPMLGVSYRFDDATHVFASTGRKTRFPTLGQLYSSKSGNAELQAWRSNNVTVGVAHPFGTLASLELSAFYYDVSDMITRTGQTALDPYLNFGKIRMAGGELAADLYPLSNVVVHLDYTYNDARDRSEPRVTDEVLWVAKRRGTVALRTQAPGWGTRLDVTALFMGEVFSSLPTLKYPTDPERKTDSYTVVDLRVGQDVGGGLEGYLVVQNVLDRGYEPEIGYPAPGRSLGIGINAGL